MSNAGKRLLATLAERFPEASAIDLEAIRPLKVGIDADLRAVAPDLAAPHLRQALAYHT